MSRRVRLRTLILWVPVATVLVLALVVGYLLWTFGSLDPDRIPRRLNVYGRTYRQSAGQLLRLDPMAVCGAARCPELLEPAVGYWPLVMPWDRPALRMVVYLRVAADGYLAYALSGGP